MADATSSPQIPTRVIPLPSLVPGAGGTFELPVNAGPLQQFTTFPDVPLFPADNQTQPCPLYSAVDYLQLIQFQNQQYEAGTLTVPQTIQLPQERIISPWQPLEASDFFRFRAYGTGSAATVTFYGRVLHEDDSITPFSYDVTTDTNGTLFTITQGTGPGFLLDAAASVPLNAVSFGNVSAMGEIGRVQGTTFTPHTLLFNGQLDGLNPLTTVNPPTTTPLNRVDNLIFNDVGAGNVPYAHTVTPTAGKRMRFTRVSWNYQCSATVGTRQIYLALKSNGNSFWQGPSTLLRTAGQFGAYNYNVESQNVTFNTNQYLGNLPSSMFFYQPISVEIIDQSAISGSDTCTPVFIRWEES